MNATNVVTDDETAVTRFYKDGELIKEIYAVGIVAVYERGKLVKIYRFKRKST